MRRRANKQTTQHKLIRKESSSKFLSDTKVKSKLISICDIFNITTGKSKSNLLTDNGNYYLIDMGGVSVDGKLIERKRINQDDELLEVNDLIMPKDDIGHGHILGKVAIIKQKDKYVLGDTVFCLRNKTHNDTDFLRLLINSEQINNSIKRLANGTAQQHLYKRELLPYTLPIPPLEKQKEIVRIISTWDKAIDLVNNHINLYKLVRKGLEHSLLGKRANKQKSFTLSEIICVRFGERITKNKNEGTKYYVYGGGDKTFMTNNYNRENEFVISRFAMSKNCVRYVPGKFWLLDSGGTFNIKEDVLNTIEKHFVGLSIMLKQKEIFSCARGLAQQNLDTLAFNKIHITIPSIKKQKEITKIFLKYDSYIETKEFLLGKYKTQRRGLIQELFSQL